MKSILELIPINPDVDEAEHVTHEDRPQRSQRAERGIVRDLEFQHHDGDDAVAEGFQAVFAHGSGLSVAGQPFLYVSRSITVFSSFRRRQNVRDNRKKLMVVDRRCRGKAPALPTTPCPRIPWCRSCGRPCAGKTVLAWRVGLSGPRHEQRCWCRKNRWANSC